MKKGDIRSADTKAALARGTSRQNERKARISQESGKAEAQTVLLRIRARREAMRLDRERGELTPADNARKTCRAFGLRVRQAFESAVETHHQSLHAVSGMDLSAARSWLSDFVREVLAEVADAEPVE